ncbi:MAG TPA: Rrf2 family transcriptional regulator [Peptococcaceae bacterium]|nr:Rrf2 family transcriptional regulator [Peptococcaceae bacterium]
MQLNQATDYAFRAVMHLVLSLPKEIVPAQTIAESEHIPMRFLLKIMRYLLQAGIVKSYRGIEGGYGLAKRPEDITLLDVVKAIEGEIAINRCLLDPKYCSKNGVGTCEIHNALEAIQNKLTEELARYNFAELAEKNAQKNNSKGGSVS